MAKPGYKARSFEQVVEDFWSKVSKTEDCWNWTGGTANSGYGQVNARAVFPMPITTHRLSWIINNGPIPKGKHVLHRCDNRLCVRPDHLFLGTQRDNNLDRDRKGRVASGNRNGARTQRHKNPFVVNRGSGLRGSRHPNSVLTEDDVKTIRKDYRSGNATKTELSYAFGVSVAHICRIVNNQSWQE